MWVFAVVEWPDRIYTLVMLSVAILSYNHPEITSRCISSVLEKIPPGQVLVYHNGSDSRYRQQLQEDFPDVYHFGRDKNGGYSGGVNGALEEAFKRSDWVFLLTNDTSLESAVRIPEDLLPGLYSPLVWFRKKDRIDYVGGRFDSRRGRLQHLAHWGPRRTEPGVFPYIPGTAFLIHKSVFFKVGPMDESLHTFWEDVDYGVRAFQRKIPMGFLPDIQVLHMGGKTTRKKSFYTSYLFRRNRVKVSWRHCPWFYKPLLGPYLVTDVLKTIFKHPAELWQVSKGVKEFH